MFAVKDVMAVCRFMEMIKQKGFLVVLEVIDDVPKLRVEFEGDNYDLVTNFCKDWILFNSSLVKDYTIAFSGCVDTTGDDQYWFIISLKERSL